MKAALFLTTLIIALVAAAALYLLRGRFAFDFPLLFGTNIFLAIVTLLSGLVSSRGNPAKTASFVNSVYGGTLMRLFLIGGAAVYIILQKGNIDTRSLLLVGVLYILYTGAETFILQKGSAQTQIANHGIGMDALAQRFRDLATFLPPRAFEAVLPYFRRYPISLTITRERKTRLGDYCAPHKGEKAHRITVNGNLNSYAFLITLLHEMAHLLVWETHRGRVAPHGLEWKTEFGKLLLSFADARLFPAALEKVVRSSAQNPASATFRDVALSKALALFDPKEEGKMLAGDLVEGTLFRGPDGKEYQMTERRRSRIKCKRISDGKEFLLPFAAEVERVESFSPKQKPLP